MQRSSELPPLLRLLAARNASELNLTSLADDARIPVQILDPYLDLLETLFLVHRLPAWSTSLSRRVVQRPKVALHGTGLAARLFHYRDRHGAEVDLVMETDDGRVAAIEVKAASTVNARDTK